MKLIHLTYHKDNKLDGITSINTSALENKFCKSMGKFDIARKDRDCKLICSYCYSGRNERAFSSLEKKLVDNSKLLSSRIEKGDLPYINSKFARFSSFGEIMNEEHMENLIRIAKKNPETTFSLLTKRCDIVMKYKKVKNIVYVASSPIIGQKITDEKILKYFDKTFTVHTEDNGNINCGLRKCVECRLCYTKTGGKEINELLRK